MSSHVLDSQHEPALFYKESCPPCRIMSRLAVILALGLIRRIPLDSREAAELYALYPGHEGQLVLVDGSRVSFQRMVYAALPVCVVRRLMRAAVKRG
jgi:hypothetical protein